MEKVHIALLISINVFFSGCSTVAQNYAMNTARGYLHRGDCAEALRIINKEKRSREILPEWQGTFDRVQYECVGKKIEQEKMRIAMNKQEQLYRNPKYRMEMIRKDPYFLSQIRNITNQEIEAALISYKKIDKSKKTDPIWDIFMRGNHFHLRERVDDQVIKMLLKHFPEMSRKIIYRYTVKLPGLGKGRDVNFQKFVVDYDVSLVKAISVVHEDITKLPKVKAFLKRNPELAVYHSRWEDGFYSIEKRADNSGSGSSNSWNNSSSSSSSHQPSCVWQWDVKSAILGGNYGQEREWVCK